MLKSFRFMLLAAFTMVCGNMLAQEETTVTWEASSGDPLTTIYPDANISLKWEEGGGDFSPKYQNGSVYFYNGNRVTVAGTANDVTIKKIVFTFSGDRYSMVTCNTSGKNESSYGITNSSADKTSTWEGEANSLIFRAPAQSKERYISSIAVTYTGGISGPVETAPVLNITTSNWNDTYDMDANGVFVVYAKNEGNAAAENVKLTVYVDAAENATWEIGTLSIGANNVWKNMKYNLEGIEAGKHQVKLALTADNAEAFEAEKEVTFTKAAAEAAFSISATNVTVAYDATSFNVVATVTNTSEVDATNVVVKLQKDITNAVAEATIESLAAGETKNVTLTVEDGPFDAGQKTYYLYVNNKYLNNVEVTVEEAPETDQIDMAITAIQGADQIDLNGTNTYKVWYKNEGNVKMEDVDIILLVNDNEAGRQAVTVEAGEQGSVDFTLNVADLFEESEDLNTEATLIAMVNVDGDIDATNNQSQMTATVVKTVAEATYEVTAQPIQIQLPAEKFNVVATVKNTSEIAAENVEVKLFYNAVIATQTIEALAAGAETTVTFADVPNPFTTAGEYSMWVQAPKTNAEVKVTVLAEVEDPVIDMAIEAIQGATEINLKEENKVTVWYKNNGNQTMENVAIMFSVNDHAQEQTVTVEAGRNGSVEFVIPTDIFEPTEDTEAELVAWVNVENDADATNNRVTKTLPIVSGEVEPAAEIALNPVANQEVEAGEQEVNVTVAVFNNGDADAENVTVDIYKNYPEVLATATFAKVEKGGSAMKTVKFTYNFETGKDYEFTAYTDFVDANGENNIQKFTISCPEQKADITVAKIAPIAATTEEDVVIAATLKNNSTVAAQNVKVGVYTIENMQYQLVGIQQTVEEIAVGEEANVEFNLGKLAAGEYTYYVQVSEDANNDNNTQDVTVKVTEPVQETIDMAIIAIQGPAEINLKSENTYKVWYKNEGNVTVENANIILLVDGENEAGRQAVTVEPGQQNFVEFTLDVADFEPSEDIGREVVLMGYVNVEGDANAENNKSQMTATVISQEEVAEPVFTIDAQPVEVQLPAEKINVTATIATDIDAENVEVQLFYNQTIATQTVSITANESATVNFEVENPFTKAGEYTMFVMAGKATAEVAVTVKPEAVDETIDMAITAIQGLSQIDLTKENKATVWYENKGTKDMEDVVVMFSVNDDVQQAIVNVAAGKNGFVEFTLDITNILPEDENAELVAWVNVEGDVDNTNDKVRKVVPVVNGETPVATFAVTAQNVTVPFGAESFDIVATVTNTSDVDAQGLTVKLLKGIEEVETKTLNLLLPAGESETVTFTVAAPEGGFVAGTAMYYVQAVNAQTEVEVTFEAEAVEGTIDMAITAIQGLSQIDVTKENKATVWYENNGTKDMENVAIMFSVNDHAMEQNVNVKAGKNGYVEFTIPANIFEPTEDVEAELIAWVNVEGDIDNTNDKVTRTVPVIYGEAVLSFTVNDVRATVDAESFDVNVNVKNTGNGAAENVAVKVYDANSQLLGETVIETIAAGAEETATITVSKTYTEVGTFRNQLQVYVAGVDGVKWVSVTVTDGITDGIAAIRAQYGENVQIYTLSGKKVSDVRRGNVYIINGKKAIIK